MAIINKKAFLSIVVFVGGFLTTLGIASSIILLNSLSRLEEQDAFRHSERVKNILVDATDDLSGLVSDWASWDDTYDFIIDANEDYIDTNLIPSTLVSLDLNLMLYVNSSGQIVHAIGADLSTKEEILLNGEDLEQILLDYNILLEHVEIQSDLSGLVSTNQGPMLVASRPITNSEETAPILGSLIFGRYLDEREIEQLSRIVNLPIAKISWGDEEAHPFSSTIESPISNDNTIAIRPLNDRVVSGYVLLRDIENNPALILQIDIPRNIFQQGMNSLYIFLCMLGAIALAFGIPGYALLVRLFKSRAELLESEECFRQLAENIESVFWMTEPDGRRTLYISPAYEKVWGQTCESRYTSSLSWLDSIHPEDRQRVVAALPKQSQGLYDETYRIARLDGKERWVHDRAFPIADDSGQIYRIAGIAEDITSYKEAEATQYKAKRAAEAASQAKSDFLAMMSHEIRTPMNAVVGMTSLLLEDELPPLRYRRGAA